MGYLYFSTALWAFSFSLIGVYLAGVVDPWFSVFIRVLMASLVFLPFLKIRSLSKNLIIKIMLIGAVQLGLMYCFYYHAFLFLTVPEVVLFTIFTPLYVTLIYDLIQGRFSKDYLITALLAVIGACVIKATSINQNFILGFLIVQGANLCFALGQVGYKIAIEKENKTIEQHNLFALFYLGALCVALPAFLLLGNWQALPQTITQWGVLIYLGAIASGLGYFCWNKGATLVNAGALAVMNNLLVPAGILVNILIWDQNAPLMPLTLGGGIIAFSLWLNQKMSQKKQDQ